MFRTSMRRRNPPQCETKTIDGAVVDDYDNGSGSNIGGEHSRAISTTLPNDKMRKSSSNDGNNAIGVHFAPDRPTFLKQWRCLLGTLLALIASAAIIVICVGLYSYLRAEADKRARAEDVQYLKKLVDVVNNAKDARWKAKFNPSGIRVQDFNHKTLKNLTAIKDYIIHLERFFDSKKMKDHLKELEEFPNSSLPLHFDSRQKWPFCPTIHSVPNQGGCGSCYAVSAMGVASDRMCIHTNGTQRSQLSALDVIECCPVCGNCFGGDPLKAMVYWALEGVVTGGPDGCRPYAVSTECGTPCSPDVYGIEQKKRKCRRDHCHPGYYRQPGFEKDIHKGSIAYTLFPRKMSIDQAGNNRVMLPSVIGHFNKTLGPSEKLSTEQIRNIIRKELLLYGPTTLALPLTEEFLHYDSGIFHPYPEKDFESRIIYWHVVRLIGWGHDSENGLYWVATNSFGEQWGENGLFRVDTTLLENFGLEYEAGII